MICPQCKRDSFYEKKNLVNGDALRCAICLYEVKMWDAGGIWESYKVYEPWLDIDGTFIFDERIT